MFLVGKSIEDLGSKIENLSNQIGLYMEFDSIQNQPTSAGIPMRLSSTSVSAIAAHSIIDELAGRDRRKKNIIIYNLSCLKLQSIQLIKFLF